MPRSAASPDTLSRDHAPRSAIFLQLVIIGAGAAGLFAAIWAARSLRESAPSARILLLDGAKKVGVKILVAGGGRCNVTHHEVDERQYAGASRNAIKKVLRRFDVPQTVAFFAQLGVHLKREQTGKLFPTTDDANTVLDALLSEVSRLGIHLIHPWRVSAIHQTPHGFTLTRDPAPLTPTSPDTISARCIILATGGMALPRSGSDGAGYALATSLGHTLTPRIFPALVPLTLSANHWITTLSGLTVITALELRSPTGKRLERFENSTLCTHFGLSGPGPLDISRYYTAAHDADPAHRLFLSWLPHLTPESLDALLLNAGRLSAAKALADQSPSERNLPERLASALCRSANIDPAKPCHSLTRIERRALIDAALQTPLPITGDRGFTFAEVTAGGIPLSELHLESMLSRACPGLHLCGEILDVDGRIGGFNFQWAWASGYAAGISAAAALTA